MPPSRTPLLLDRISLRERERALLIGGTGSGKSTLADQLGTDWDRRYAARNGRRLIVDSKPRYRAALQTDGTSAHKRYKSWGHGRPVPGSVVVDSPDQLAWAWRMTYRDAAGVQRPVRVAIVQGEGAADIPRMIATVRQFYKQANANRPQLAQFDETLDFFHSNGSPRGGDDVIQQIARAGRERGIAALYGSQRTYGIPSTLMSELAKLYAFRLDNVKDAKRFQEMGAPEFSTPTVEHEFMYWTKRDYPTIYGPYKLSLPD